jgi:HSP20 family molecular chaperone IbpA
MKETPDSYIVSLKVPEHERENITISPRNRYIKITYHRKHSDRVEEQDGSSHTSKRTELMTKQFPTEAILNSKGVTQKYEDGVLKFKVLKA